MPETTNFPPVTVRPVQYRVCALPDDHPDARHFAIDVQYRDKGWAVVRLDTCLGADGTWDEGVKPYGRGTKWLTAHRFDHDTALRLATEAAPHVVVNGYTVTDVLTDA